jgi:Putative Ig domain
MPIANTPLTAVQFEALQQNITDVYHALQHAGTIAQSGLQYVVDLQTAAPEVDLVIPFYQQYLKIDGLNSVSNFTTIAASLNLHAITRGATATGDLSTRLNEYLARTDNAVLGPVKVDQDYATISSAAGFLISSGHIDPTVVISTLTLPGGTHNVAYSQTVAVSGGTAPILFNLTAGRLPTGLALEQDNGLISGTPTVIGTFAFTITAEDSIGSSTSVDYVVAIA